LVNPRNFPAKRAALESVPLPATKRKNLKTRSGSSSNVISGFNGVRIIPLAFFLFFSCSHLPCQKSTVFQVIQSVILRERDTRRGDGKTDLARMGRYKQQKYSEHVTY
jgi:hypothetical protein